MVKRTRQVDSTRPFRIWNAQEKKDERWRYYGHALNAHWGCLKEMLWVKPGITLEVYNVSNGRLYGQYTRTLTGVKFVNLRGTKDGQEN